MSLWFLMAEAIPLTRNGGFLRRRTSHGGWRSGGARRSNKLLGFWGLLYGENLWEVLRKLKALWVLRKLKSFWFSDAGQIKSDEQLNELIVERLGSFIGSSVAKIHNAYLELNLSQTRVNRDTQLMLRCNSQFKMRRSRWMLPDADASVALDTYLAQIELKIHTAYLGHWSIYKRS